MQSIDLPEHLGYIRGVTLLQHVSPEENMNRWYFVDVQPTLFDTWTIVVAWGRRDSDFQHWRSVSMESDDQAYQVATKIIEKKLRKGYRVVE